MKKLLRISVLGYILSITPLILNGQESSIIDSVTIEEISISAAKVKISPIAFESIDVEENKISAVERIDQYLNFIPGVEMQSGALNTNRIVFRGIGSRSPFATSKLRAYLDDIPLTDGVGETSIEDINLESIANIDIWKGPFRSSYGAGLGGVILYESKDISNQANYIISDNTIGDFGFLRTDNTYSNKINNNNAIVINQEFLSSNGYRDNNDYQKSFTGITYKNIGNNYVLTGLFNHIDLRSEIPSSLNLEDYNDEPQKAAANWGGVQGYEDYRKSRLGLNFGYAINNESSFSSTIYGYVYNAYELRPFNVLDDQSKALSIRNIYNLEKGSSNFSLGHEWYRESYDWQIFDTVEGIEGPQEEEGNSIRNIFNLFAEYAYDLSDRITLGGGINLHYNSISLSELYNDVNTEKSYDPIISPRFFIQYSFHKNILSRLDIGHGYSNPGLDESLDASGRFNVSIEQEKGWNYDLGVSFSPSQKIKFAVSAFLMDINNIIVNRQDNNGNTFGINAGKTKHRGLEATLNISHPLADKTTLTFIGSGELGDYTFIDFIDNGVDYSGNDLTGIAGDKLNSKIKLDHHSTTFLLSHRYVSSIPLNDANNGYSDSYHLTGFYFNQDINLGKLILGISTEVDNIFNNKYASMIAVNARGFGSNLPRYYYPGLPVNGKFSLSVKYLFD